MPFAYLLGILYAIISALCAALVQAVLSKPIIKSDSSSVAFFTVLVGLAASVILTLATSWIYFLEPLDLLIIAIFATVGVVQYGISRRLFYYSIRNLGANITSPIIMMTMTVGAVVLAAALLREKVTIPLLIGISFVIFGGLLLEGRLSAELRGGATKTGYMAAIGAGIIPAFTAILISYGLSIYPYVIASVFISYAAASVYYIVTMRTHSIALLFGKVPRKSIVAFISAGVVALAAQLFRAGALSEAPVVLVIPFLTSSSLFIPLFTWVLAKDVELFSLRTMLGIVIVTVGLILVTI